jgi:anti-sigma28 factor (negative regulator of flagellin synthesis)
MSNMSEESGPEIAMNTIASDNRFLNGRRPEDGRAGAARLQAIHDLIRSGDYHVPAAAIANRIIERMIAEKRGSAY